MAAGKCSPPKSEGVRSYVRAKRKAKPKPKPKGSTYWECHSSSGRWCGTEHRTSSGAYKHSRQLDRQARARHAGLTRAQAKGRRVEDWVPEKRTR